MHTFKTLNIIDFNLLTAISILLILLIDKKLSYNIYNNKKTLIKMFDCGSIQNGIERNTIDLIERSYLIRTNMSKYSGIYHDMLFQTEWRWLIGKGDEEGHVLI